MKAIDVTYTWQFDKPITDGSIIECPECNKSTPLSDWVESAVDCDICGDHASIVCPECCEHFDHVWAPVFKVK